MATYYTNQSRTFGTRIGQGAARELVTATAIVAMTTAMIDNTNDLVGLFWLPKGAVVVGVTVAASDMDTNGAPTLAFDIGDADDQNRLIAASAVGQAGTLKVDTVVPSTGFLYKYTADTLINAYVQAVAATGAAGTLYVAVTYFVDPEFSTTALTATTTA